MANGMSYEGGRRGGGGVVWGGRCLDVYVNIMGSFLSPKAQGVEKILTSSIHKPLYKKKEKG